MVNPPSRELLAALFEASRDLRAEVRETRERSKIIRAESDALVDRIVERRLALAAGNGDRPLPPETLIRGIDAAVTMPADA